MTIEDREKYLDTYELEFTSKLPEIPTKFLYSLYVGKVDYHQKLYINNNGILKLIGPSYLAPVLLFLKKYRKNPELLKEIIKDENNKEKYQVELKKMQILLTKMNTFKEFKQALNLATNEISKIWFADDKKELDIMFSKYYYGNKLVFVNKKEDLGSIINIFGEIIPLAKKEGYTTWGRAVLFDVENKIFELYYEDERSNDWHLHLVFYEEKYLYEYFLNEELNIV
jgi:hypothetical protein